MARACYLALAVILSMSAPAASTGADETSCQADGSCNAVQGASMLQSKSQRMRIDAEDNTAKKDSRAEGNRTEDSMSEKSGSEESGAAEEKQKWTLLKAKAKCKDMLKGQESIKKVSKDECASMCADHAECNAFSYRPVPKGFKKPGVCVLSKECSTHIKHKGWKTYRMG